MSQDLSNKELQLLADDSDSGTDAGGLAQDLLQGNARPGGANGMDGDAVDGEGEDGSEDDMMDKISSSPSIDDGRYPLPISWPKRGQSLFPGPLTVVSEASSVSGEDNPSSSPFLESPVHFPLIFPRKDQVLQRSEDHHHMGEYAMEPQKRSSPVPYSPEQDFSSSPPVYPHRFNSFKKRDSFDNYFDELEASKDDDLDEVQLHDLLLPTSDSLLDNSVLLDNSFDDTELDSSPLNPQQILRKPAFDIDSDQTLEVYKGDNDDDTEDISFSDDSRFVDSGWGGECLQEIEDIDFEFVYALHTFVATVEGQANATKGETMVLLDDSNSYWWLVRVVRDGSIG